MDTISSNKPPRNRWVFTLAFWFIAVAIVMQLAVIVGIIWAACHFISKFW